MVHVLNPVCRLILYDQKAKNVLYFFMKMNMQQRQYVSHKTWSIYLLYEGINISIHVYFSPGIM